MDQFGLFPAHWIKPGFAFWWSSLDFHGTSHDVFAQSGNSKTLWELHQQTNLQPPLPPPRSSRSAMTMMLFSLTFEASLYVQQYILRSLSVV
jgi:hypothetical protein